MCKKTVCPISVQCVLYFGSIGLASGSAVKEIKESCCMKSIGEPDLILANVEITSKAERTQNQ